MNFTDEREKVLFREALQRASGPGREAFLNQACAGNEALRARLEALLQAHESNDSFLEPPVGAPTVTVPLDSAPREGPGTLIGRYKILEEVGEGGFGVVYVAEQQEPLKRQVALKIIKLGMDTRQVVARFEAERQALALMEHPCIAKVLDAGATKTGRPYFVMELVRGIPITRYCEEEKLSTRQRLDLFMQVCHAIQHAHQKGIIHRDIKPSNILVARPDPNAPGVPKVIDFGIAKATQQELATRTVYTQFQQFLGTPAYMSPEQAAMSGHDIDTRSDIYSLGVLLYELLTGSTPFDAKELLQSGLDEMRKIIREREPLRPSTRLRQTATFRLSPSQISTLKAQLSTDLDWVVMKCLEKDRERRYETANGLAKDIQSYLSHQPVIARPHSGLYRLGKFIRRHKLGFAAGTAVAVALALGTVVSTVQARRARKAEKRMRMVLNFFQDKVLSATRPKGQEGGLGRDVTLRAAIAEAEPSIAGSFTNQPEVEASIRSAVGQTYYYLGELTNAIAQFERFVALTKARLGPDDPETLKGMNNLAVSYDAAGRLAEALALRQQVLQLRKAKLGPNHPDTLSAMNALAISYGNAGRWKEELELDEEAFQLQKARLGPNHPSTLRAMNGLAAAYFNIGRRDEALKLREETVRLMQANLGPNHPDTLGVMINLANSYQETGRQDEALKLAEQTLALVQAQLGPDHPQTLIAMHTLARVYQYAGRQDEAVELFKQTVQLTRAKLGPDHPQTLRAMNALAFSYGAAGEWTEAVKLREQVLQLTKAKLGPDHSDTLKVMGDLAFSYGKVGRRDEVLSLQEQTLQLTRARLGPDHPETLQAMGNLAVFYSEANRREEAIGLLEAALQLMQAKLGPTDPITFWTMKNLAFSYVEVGRKDEAANLLSRMLELRKAGLGPVLGVYPRSAPARAELLDLSGSFDAGLNEDWLDPDPAGNDLALLPHGLQTFGGVRFDVRGIVQLRSKALGRMRPEYPDRVEGIVVSQKCRRLHFLHGADGTNVPDAAIARYLVHYGDGRRQEVPVRYSQEVLGWHQSKDPPGKDLTGAAIAWEGSQVRWANSTTNCLRLYRMTWENPRPDEPIETLDFISSMEEAAPFLLAITAE